MAMGFIQVANEAMCRPIRALTQARGHDTSRHVLACFGGAGGQHACAIARSLGMKTVLIHRYSGILSAYGMALADVVHEEQEACSKSYEPGRALEAPIISHYLNLFHNLGFLLFVENFEYIDNRLNLLSRRCFESLTRRGFKDDQVRRNSFSK